MGEDSAAWLTTTEAPVQRRCRIQLLGIQGTCFHWRGTYAQQFIVCFFCYLPPFLRYLLTFAFLHWTAYRLGIQLHKYPLNVDSA